MIAFSKKKRGRPVGSKNRGESLGRAAHGVEVGGAATSAAKMNCRPGFAPIAGIWLYVPGEGFVRWSEIERSVSGAYLHWRRKKAMEGVMIYDWQEQRQNEITAGGGKGTARRDWLREWSARHAELCRVANVESFGAMGGEMRVAA